MDTARSIVHSVTHYIKNTDLYLMLLGLVCSIYGMLLIYSATLNPVTALDGSTKNLYVQGAAIILGLAAFVALSLIDLENLGDLWKIFCCSFCCLRRSAPRSTASVHGSIWA